MRAAGILLQARSTRRYLFLQEHDGTWVTPGGRLDRGEDELDAALREFQEETSYPGPVTVRWPGAKRGNYTLFRGVVARQFRPVVSHEHVGYTWRSADDLPEPLHPGLRRVFS